MENRRYFSYGTYFMYQPRSNRGRPIAANNYRSRPRGRPILGCGNNTSGNNVNENPADSGRPMPENAPQANGQPDPTLPDSCRPMPENAAQTNGHPLPDSATPMPENAAQTNGHPLPDSATPMPENAAQTNGHPLPDSATPMPEKAAQTNGHPDTIMKDSGRPIA
ncbi:hypothetical protein EGW08_003283 [Elysia chlorotica]|uniref:Uncharacterized protein n=1 Tax=Elysia chlorotica TaxID=188477 RepID=A0A3S1BQD6_ELYCH|nr:hypothetical protein EGW08_003283 [Elysia chlorotica]